MSLLVYVHVGYANLEQRGKLYLSSTSKWSGFFNIHYQSWYNGLRLNVPSEGQSTYVWDDWDSNPQPPQKVLTQRDFSKQAKRVVKD